MFIMQLSKITYDYFDVGLVLRQFQTKRLGQRGQRGLTGSICRGNGTIGSKRQALETAYVVDINNGTIIES